MSKQKKKPIAIAGQFFSRNATKGWYPAGKVYYWRISKGMRSLPFKEGECAIVDTSHGKARVFITAVIFSLPEGTSPERFVVWFPIPRITGQKTAEEQPNGSSDKDNEPQEFKAKLHALLTERKMSQSELARRVGVTRQCISLYLKKENNQYPNPETLRKIADVLEVTPQWLAGNE